jgi:hypothetical protein
MIRYLLFFCILFVSTAAGQYNGYKFSIAVNGVYTTSARIYLQPNASDEVIRNNYLPVEDLLNPPAELRFAISKTVLLGISSEYMYSVQDANIIVFTDSAVRPIRVEDGFSFIPVEISAYYILPFSTEKFKFLIGGGAAYYHGNHVRKFGNASVTNVERKFSYGIHVSLSMDYLLRENLSVRTEMKFRDPQFTVKSAYDKSEVLYEGRSIQLLQKSFDSRINIDGVTFLAGLAYYF